MITGLMNMKGDFDPYTIHVTEVGDCPRKFWFNLTRADKLKYPKVSLRGIMAHNFVSEFYRNQPMYTHRMELPKVAGYVELDRIGEVDISMHQEIMKSDMPEIAANFFKWISATKIPQAWSELVVEHEHWRKDFTDNRLEDEENAMWLATALGIGTTGFTAYETSRRRELDEQERRRQREWMDRYR